MSSLRWRSPGIARAAVAALVALVCVVILTAAFVQWRDSDQCVIMGEEGASQC